MDDPNKPLPAWVRRYAAIQERNRKRRGCVDTDSEGKSKRGDTGKPWKKVRTTSTPPPDNRTTRASQNTLHPMELHPQARLRLQRPPHLRGRGNAEEW